VSAAATLRRWRSATVCSSLLGLDWTGDSTCSRRRMEARHSPTPRILSTNRAIRSRTCSSWLARFSSYGKETMGDSTAANPTTTALTSPIRLRSARRVGHIRPWRRELMACCSCRGEGSMTILTKLCRRRAQRMASRLYRLSSADSTTHRPTDHRCASSMGACSLRGRARTPTTTSMLLFLIAVRSLFTGRSSSCECAAGQVRAICDHRARSSSRRACRAVVTISFMEYR